MKTVFGKFAGMRKAQEFVVYPYNPAYDNGTMQVQSDHAIGQFDRKTGVGVLNWRGSNAKYGVHLSMAAGAEPYTFPPEFVAQCQEHQLQPGDKIAPNLYVA